MIREDSCHDCRNRAIPRFARRLMSAVGSGGGANQFRAGVFIGWSPAAFHGALFRQSSCRADCFFQCVLDFGSLIAKQHIPNSALPSEGVHSTRLLSVCHGVTALTCGTFADSSGAGTCTLGWYRRLWRGSDMETRSELCSGHNFGHNRPQSSALNVPRIMAK